MHAAIPLKSSPSSATREPAGPGAPEALHALYRILFLCTPAPESVPADAPESQPPDPGPEPHGCD